jgi:Tol biopolymer transport system component/aminoglycoside phosphotransferase (APT) family kinase protein
MPLTPGSRLGPYEIVSPLGAGGMGEVFRARDTRLGREVAIKSLPAGFAQDPERLARFEREAKLLASLSHPNVAGIHGLEQVEGHRYLVLEFVAGETLAARLGHGALPVDEALQVCAQVAGAVEAAHEAGVIHRDLKPGNIMLKGDGTVKVLDFGLAKSGTASGSDPNLSASPTLTNLATSVGVILGTAAYMSPEQARGRSVDRRTDIWSFGCVLYECLTGQQAFAGETVSDVIARILQTEPDWSALPAGTPRRVRELLGRCLRRDAKERQRDIGDARLELLDAHAGRGEAAPPTAADGRGTRNASRAWAVGLALTTVLALGFALLRPPGAPPRPLVLALTLPASITIATDAIGLAISPDGRKVVFAGRDTSGAQQLWLRGLDREDTRPLAGTAGGSDPFWAPDSRRIAFFANGKLVKLNLETGATEALCDGPLPRGGAWGRGFIVLQPQSTGPLVKVPEDGGTPVPTTVTGSGPGDVGHRFPSFLPDGRHFVFSVIPGHEGAVDIAVGSLDGGRPKFVSRAQSGATYAAPGYLIAVEGVAVRAQRFDVRTLSPSGPRVTVPGLRALSPNAFGGPIVSASGTGILAQNDVAGLRKLYWVDREGHVSQPIATQPGTYQRFHVSPDGARVVAEWAPDQAADAMIWIIDLARQTMQRHTFEGQNFAPVWSADGRRVTFGRELHGSHQDLWTMAADVPGSERLLAKMPLVFNTCLGWLPDGSALTVRSQGTDTQQDVWLVTPGDSLRLTPLFVTRFNELYGSVSPDGGTIAYLSDESGRLELYVREFPSLGAQRCLSTAGAYGQTDCSEMVGEPHWRRDGRELTYVAADARTVMSIAVTPGRPPQFATPRLLFRLPRGVAEMSAAPNLDRFLVALEAEGESRSIEHVIVDWSALVESGK